MSRARLVRLGWKAAISQASTERLLLAESRLSVEKQEAMES